MEESDFVSRQKGFVALLCRLDAAALLMGSACPSIFPAVSDHPAAERTEFW